MDQKDWKLMLKIFVPSLIFVGLGFLSFQTRVADFSSFWFPSAAYVSMLMIDHNAPIKQHVSLSFMYFFISFFLSFLNHSYVRSLGIAFARLIQALLAIVLIQAYLSKSWSWRKWQKIDFSQVNQSVSFIVFSLFSGALSSLMGTYTITLTSLERSVADNFLIWFSSVSTIHFLFVPLFITFQYQLVENWHRRTELFRKNWRKIVLSVILISLTPIPVWLSETLIRTELRLVVGIYIDSVLVLLCVSFGGILASSLAVASSGITIMALLLKDPFSWKNVTDVETASSIATIALFAIMLSMISLLFAAVLNERDNAFKFVEQQVKERTCQLEVLLKDLRESKLITEKLSQGKSEFMAFLCHELRNPLHAILNIVQDDKEKIDKLTIEHSDVERLEFGFSSVLSYCKYMMNLLNDVLDFEKLAHQDTKLNLSTIDLFELFNELVSRTKDYFRHKNIDFDFTITKTVPRKIFSDKTKLIQVTSNLLANGFKFTQHGGLIKMIVDCDLSLKPSENSILTITVKDNGPGLKPETKKYIFQPYRQVSHGFNEHTGSGLGLSIAHKLVMALGGSIEFESMESKGTVFIVKVPFDSFEMTSVSCPESSPSTSDLTQVQVETLQVAHDDEIVVESIETDPLKSTLDDSESTHSLHASILVVDDSEINRRILLKLLKRIVPSSTIIHEATDGLEAVEMTRENSYTLIFMDIVMPNMDGYEASKAIRKFNHQSAIIAATGNVLCTAEAKATIAEAGMNDVLGKPFTATELKGILERHHLITITQVNSS